MKLSTRKFATRKTQLATRNFTPKSQNKFAARKITLQFLNLFSQNRNSQLITHNLQLVSYKTTSNLR